MMTYYPIFLDIKDRRCLVAGGGSVGTRKALGLARAGALVKVVSPVFSTALSETECKTITLEEKEFEVSDLDGICLAFAATSNRELNARIRETARKNGIWCNIADGPDKGDFILPAVVDRGDLMFAVSTCGASPALSRRLRRDLENRFGPEYNTLVTLLGQIRTILLDREHDPQGHRRIFNALLDQNLPQMIAAGQTQQIDAVLSGILGEGFSYKQLMPGKCSQES